MGQAEIFEWLKTQDNKLAFSVRAISEHMNERGISTRKETVCDDVKQLERHGYLESHTQRGVEWKKYYRIKKGKQCGVKYVDRFQNIRVIEKDG